MNGLKKPPLTDKSVQRGLFREKRRALMRDSSLKTALDREIQSRLILSSAYRDADTVLVYAAREDEIATSMIIFAALANHKTVALPRCEGEGVMRFCRIRSMSDLTLGRYGIREPKEGCEEVEAGQGSLCVCPALCCDMRGARLGWGKGYYDRFLSGYAGISAALCYADALLPELATEPHDVPVSMIVTDQFIKEIR